MSYYPNFSELLANKSERLLEVHRSLWSIMSNMIIFLALVVIVYLINYFYPRYTVPRTIPLIGGATLRWLAVFPVLMLLEIIRRYHDDLYVFHRDYIKHLGGRLSLSYSVPALNYSDIRSIWVDQDVMGRILNYGTVILGSAAEEENELWIEGVRGPQELANLVEELRDFNVKGVAPSQSTE